MRKGVNILSMLLMIPVYFYQWFISPLKGPSCRHVPTCSTYFIQALRKHGTWPGLKLATNRILRCRPGGTHGYDPVPAILFKKYNPKSSATQKRERCNRLKEH